MPPAGNPDLPPDTTQDLHRLIRPQFALASLGAALVGIAYLLLPEGLTVGPNWLVFGLDAVVLLPLLYAAFFRPLPHHMARGIRTSLQAALTLALLSSLVLLVSDLPRFSHGGQLLRPAALLWLSNILIFAGWYWELDGSGPVKRHLRGHPAVDFLFPQQAQATRGRSWAPGFVDYLFLAFCFATALSPADTAPLSPRAKLLMIGEALISLAILGLLIARSVNIL
jgi:hypothetical protein